MDHEVGDDINVGAPGLKRREALGLKEAGSNTRRQGGVESLDMADREVGEGGELSGSVEVCGQRLLDQTGHPGLQQGQGEGVVGGRGGDDGEVRPGRQGIGDPQRRVGDGKTINVAGLLVLAQLGGVDAAHVAVPEEDAEHTGYSLGVGSAAAERQMPRRLPSMKDTSSWTCGSSA